MGDELTRRGGRYGKALDNGIHGIIFVNGEVIKHFNANIKAIDVLYMSISAFYFLRLYLQHHI
jgi:hypothetical protein